MFRLSVCADTVFCDLPYEERFREITRAGFDVDMWGWTDRNIDALAAIPGARVSGMTGYVAGSIVHPAGVHAFLDGVERSIAVAKKLRCRDLILSTGEIGYGGKIVHAIADHPATRWITAYKALGKVAELAERHDVTYHLENLNTKIDHAGYPLARAEDVARLVEEVNSPRLRLLLDVYHAQVQEGNVLQVIRDHGKLLGYVHVADVPGRHEPGTGELNYPRVAQALREVGYGGPVALEAFPEKDPHLALRRFREAFS
jgi:hydroxypyruvate isomerase